MSHLNRRTFIKNSALAAAVAGLSAQTYAQSAGANGDLRVAVVGFRSRGNEHIKELKKIKGVRIVALCDVDSNVVAKGLKENPGAKGYTDMRKMLEDKDIDAVSIASPNHLHAIQGIWSLQAGKHLYIEKPLSHNIFEGQQLVAASNHFSKLVVQAGTQSRSGAGIRAAIKDVHAGKYGKVKVSRAICYKRRKSIGPAMKNAVSADIDYDLWNGPADIQESIRGNQTDKVNETGSQGSVHYDWHWFWNYGGGDLCNQAIHEIDIARWFLNTHEVSPEVVSVGGRFGYVDCAETPNTFISIHNYAAAPLITEVYGLTSDGKINGPMNKFGAFSEINKDHKEKKSAKSPEIGIIVECENATIVVPDYNSAQVYDKDGKFVKTYGKTVDAVDLTGGASGHHANWVAGIRKGSSEGIHAPVRECHLSTALVHSANISFRLGAKKSAGEIKEALKASSGLSEAFGRMAEHLGRNGVNLDEAKATLGAPLTQDTKTELFTGANAEAANRDLVAKRTGRKGFEIPTTF
jgi:predicted dehydrogenase